MPGIAGRRVDPAGDGLAAVVTKDLGRGSSDEHSLLSARLLARKAPGDLFGSRKEKAVSSSNRTLFS